jgi:hypothetical protein
MEALQYKDGLRTFRANAAVGDGIRVRLSSGELVACAAGEPSIGVTARQAFAADEYIAVAMWNASGTFRIEATGAVAFGSKVYGAAAGKATDTPGGEFLGICVKASTAAGPIEVMPVPEPGYKVTEAHALGDTLLDIESGSCHTNLGAAGAIVIALPAALVGMEFEFQVQAAQALRIDPNGTETISLPSTGVAGAAGKYLEADAVGETVRLRCFKAGTWGVVGHTGTWTAES